MKYVYNVRSATKGVDLREILSLLSRKKAYSFLNEGDWLQGGCGLLAQALHKIMPEYSIKVVGRYKGNVYDHLVLKLADGCFFDANGLQTKEALLRNCQYEWLWTKPLFITSPDWNLLKANDVLASESVVIAFSRYIVKSLRIDVDLSLLTTTQNKYYLIKQDV